MVSATGIDPQEKIRSVQDWPVPKCVRDVRAFFSLASYYRKFVTEYFATIDLLSGYWQIGMTPTAKGPLPL